MVLLVAIFPVAAYIVYLLLAHAGVGFDITDEAYYLLSADQADAVSLSSSQFGHYIGVLYELVNQDIEHFRQLGVFILLAVSLWFSFQVKRYWVKRFGPVDRFLGIFLHLAVAVSALNYYGQWMLTPSYNWLTLVGILLTTSALLTSATRAPIVIDFVLLGVGGALLFLSKAPAAVLIAVLAVLWFLLHQKHYQFKSYFLISTVSAVAFLLFHAWFFDAGPIDTFNEMRNGNKSSGLLGGGHSVNLIFYKLFNDVLEFPGQLTKLLGWPFFFFPMFLWIIAALQIKQAQKTQLIVAYSLFVLAAIWYFLWSRNMWSVLNAGYGFMAIAFTALLLVFASSLHLLPSDSQKKQIVLSALPLQLLLFMSVFAFAIGSTRTTVQQSSLAAMFLVTSSIYSGLLIDKLISRQVFTPVILLFSSLSLLLIMSYAIYNPYRLNGDLDKQTESVSFIGNAREIKVEPATAQYINELKTQAAAAGWQSGELLLDLTGGSPGASVILAARVMPTPWLLGGYKGSTPMVEYILAHEPTASLQNAWVLTAPEGRRKLDLEVLKSVGLVFPDDYTQVAELLTGHRQEKQVLWRPTGVK